MKESEFGMLLEILRFLKAEDEQNKGIAEAVAEMKALFMAELTEEQKPALGIH